MFPVSRAGLAVMKLTDPPDKTIRDLFRFARHSDPKRKATDMNDLVEESLFFVSRRDGNAPRAVSPQLARAMPTIHMEPNPMQPVPFRLILDACQAPGNRGSVVVRASGPLTLQVESGVADRSHVGGTMPAVGRLGEGATRFAWFRKGGQAS